MSKMFLEIKKYIPEKHIFDIMNFFKEHKTQFNFSTFKSQKILKLKIHNTSLFGGVDDSKNIKIKIKNTNYEVKIFEYKDGYSKIINFVKINSIYNENNDDFNNNDFCGIIIIDKENNAVIQSINNYTDCIKCFENKSFKVGEILLRIMICICVHKDVKKVQLTDNSYLECGNDKIPLIYLRTITHGEPYYIKFKFHPINHNKNGENDYYKNELQIYKDNFNTFKNNPTIKKDILIEIFNYQNFDKIKDKNMLNYLNNILIPSIVNTSTNDIQIKDFVAKLIEDKKKISCLLLMNILMTIFYKCGYKAYKYKYFEYVFELFSEEKTC